MRAIRSVSYTHLDVYKRQELTRDEAIIVMVESNLQRTTILPSEKVFAYKMRLEAMNRQGERIDLTSSPLDNKSVSYTHLDVYKRQNCWL